MVNMENLHPVPHWSKRVFKENRVPVSAVARFLDLSFPYTVNLLNGHVRVTASNDAKLRQLVEHLERSNDGN